MSERCPLTTLRNGTRNPLTVWLSSTSASIERKVRECESWGDSAARPFSVGQVEARSSLDAATMKNARTKLETGSKCGRNSRLARFSLQDVRSKEKRFADRTSSDSVCHNRGARSSAQRASPRSIKHRSLTCGRPNTFGRFMPRGWRLIGSLGCFAAF
eukprot:scaffold1178_cov252-Pinguiococcus_pyrenoidosus.AAC.47